MRSNLHSNLYPDTLLSSEVYPDYSEIRELVLNHSVSRRVTSGKRWFFAGVLAGALIVAGLWEVLPQHEPARYVSTQGSYPISSISSPGVEIPGATHSLLVNIDDRTATESEEQALTRNQERINEPSLHELPLARSRVDHTSADSTNSKVSIPSSHNADVNLANNDHNRWMVFAAGGCLVNSGRMGGLQAIAGALGVQFRWNDRSSVVLEARRSVFPGIAQNNSTLFRDTIISLNGSSYSNTLGSTAISATPFLNSVLSLDAGYRLEFIPTEFLSSYAALYFGGSLSGIVNAACLGVRYHLGPSYCFDLSARVDQLVARNRTPQRTMGIEATAGFEW